MSGPRPQASPSASSLEELPVRLDHGVIGNGCMLALIAPDTGVDWLCMPRFDSPSVFARLLDREKGGTWRFLVDGKPVRGNTKYVRNTNVLLTRFETPDWAFDLFDYMPRIPSGLRVHTPLRVMRVLKPRRGAPRITMEFDPRPDYGRKEARLVPFRNGVAVHGGEAPLSLFSNVPAPYIIQGQSFALDRMRYFGLEYGPAGEPPHMDEIRRDLDLTIAGWRQWAQNLALPGFADRQVIRSALCLKLHAYEETGAIIAASTTSIPEALGEPRTWDYRYCWLRDAAFTVEALRRVGHFQEGRNFMHFVRDVVEGGALQPLYGIGGERDLEEYELPHLEGFRGTKPVRIGNKAAEQVQNDLMGEVVLCLRTLLLDDRVEFHRPESWYPIIERMVLEARIAQDDPDLGIWEYRAGPRVHTFSQAMCWAAMHHGAALARNFGRAAESAQWRQEAETLRQRILEQAWQPSLGMFTETYGGTDADASILLLPILGLLPATDPRFQSTLEKYRKILVRDRGVMRYVHQDDFGDPKSAFTICSFWWIEALALAGHLDEAIDRFHTVAGHANELGLLSEDVSLETGELLGNFPQAYTHVGLINAACTIGTLLRVREGRFHAWS